MSLERKKILEMLAARKISAEEAEKLLDRISAAVSAADDTPKKSGDGSATESKKPRYLRILVEKPGQDQVNLRVPLSLTRTGRLLAILPGKVSERLADHGIDLGALAELSEEDLTRTIEDLNIDIERGNGKKVRIFCE